MPITKFKLAAISVLVLAGAATAWLIQRQSEIKLREKINSLQAELDQLNQQRTDSEHPSNPLTQADQSRELLRLRSEVGLLRNQTNELLNLNVENRQLRSSQASSGRAQRPPNLAAGDSVPVESMAFVGYATPEAAFESTLSAHVKNDLKTLFEGFTPERRQEEEKKFAGKSEDELAAQAADHTAHFAGADARILKSTLLSEDEAELVVFLGTKENELVTITTKRIAGEWKISRERH